MRNLVVRSLLTALILGLSSWAAHADIIRGRVIAVRDGDTLTLLTSARLQVEIRLADIDAPELDQAYGREARAILARLVNNKDIDVITRNIDRYGRVVGTPFDGDLDISQEMIRQGAAWVYREYSSDITLLKLEEQSRQSKTGLWGQSSGEVVQPWLWRRGLTSTGDRVEGCNIKGNINHRGERIYHKPGMSSYSMTKISEEKGERWFCDEQEAQAAGWRAARSR